MVTHLSCNFTASRYILMVSVLLALVVWSGFVEAGGRAPDIYPGVEIKGVARLGSDINRTVSDFVRRHKESKITRQETQNGGTIETGMGIKFVYDRRNKIQQIITLDPNLFTQRHIHVLSHEEDVLRTYGRGYKIVALKDGHYIGYPQLGIGFDVGGKTSRVRSIVIFMSP